jgi:hypothetical protein
LEYLDATTVGVGDNLSLTVKNNNGTVENTITVSDPFSYHTVSGQFTATQQDVERGYVIFEYDFSGLGSSVDLSFVIDKFTVTKRESS